MVRNKASSLTKMASSLRECLKWADSSDPSTLVTSDFAKLVVQYKWVQC